MAGLWTLYGRQWTLYGRRWGLYIPTVANVEPNQPGGFIPLRKPKPVIYVRDEKAEAPVETEAPAPKPEIEDVFTSRIDVDASAISGIIAADMAEARQETLAIRKQMQEIRDQDDALALLLLLAA